MEALVGGEEDPLEDEGALAGDGGPFKVFEVGETLIVETTVGTATSLQGGEKGAHCLSLGVGTEGGGVEEGEDMVAILTRAAIMEATMKEVM